MANINITNLDIGGVILQNAEFRDELLKFAGADVAAEGTILARQEVATAITVAAGSNTGDGTVTLATVAGAEVPIAGAWNLEFTAALVVKLEDPNGRIIASNVDIADGGAIVLNIAGMQFTVTDGTTAFVSGDTFSLTVVADGDLVYFAPDGVAGAQTPLAILTYPVTATGVEDIPVRAGVAGSYRKERLVIDADGDASNVTDVVMDQLRNYGLVPIDVQELNTLDNQ